MNKDGSISIRVQPTTRLRLMRLGQYGDSMDDIICRLLPKETKKKEAVNA